MDKSEFKELFQRVMKKEMEEKEKKKKPLKSRDANSKKRKRKPEKKKSVKSKALAAFTKLIRLGGIGPLIYKDLPENPKLRAKELLKRVREKGFR